MDESDSFTRFVRASSPGLLQAGWLLTGDWHLAQDLVQTALARTWPRWSSIYSTDAAGAYVRKAMVRTFISWRSRRWIGELPTAEVGSDLSVPDTADQTGTHAVIAAALARLSRQQRATVVLRYFLDLSDSQAAAAMGCSVPTVKRHTSRALATLRSDATISALMAQGVL